MIAILFACVSDLMGDQMVEAYSRTGRVMPFHPHGDLTAESHRKDATNDGQYTIE